MKREAMVMYRCQLEALTYLTNVEDVRLIVNAILRYGFDGEEVEIPDRLMFGWSSIKGQIDASNKKYDSKVQQTREAGLKSAEKRRVLTDVDGRQQTLTDVNNKEKDKDKDKDKEPPDGGGLIARDARPHAPGKYPETVEEVIAISKEPDCAAPMTQQQADEYFTTRLSGDWVDAAGRRIKPSQVPFDIRKWVMGDRRRKRPRASPGRIADADIPVRELTEDEIKYGAADF